jgi:hypothetical protein
VIKNYFRYIPSLPTCRLGISFLIVGVLSFGCCKACKKNVAASNADVNSAQKAAQQCSAADESQKSLLEKSWGIRIESLHLSAAGYMLDFRYHVLDANKAKPLFDPLTKPYLIDQTSGAVFAVPSPPKVGQLRNVKEVKEGKTYFVFFANPGKYVKAGNKVTVVIGDFRAENLIVQ